MECSACSKRYDERSWAKLAVVKQLDARNVRCFVLRWPDEQFIEVRVCLCGHHIAARRTLMASG
jgi:hypothetical protein